MVLMACGTLEGAMQIFAESGQSIVSNVFVTEYRVPDDVVTDVNTLNYLNQNNITIGTFAIAI